MGVLKHRRARTISLTAQMDDPEMMFPAALAAAIDAYHDERDGQDPDDYSAVRTVLTPLFVDGGILLARQMGGDKPLTHLLDPVADALDVCSDVIVVRTSRLAYLLQRNAYNSLYEDTFENIVNGATCLVVILDGFASSRAEEDLRAVLSTRFCQCSTILFGPDLDEMKTIVSTALGAFVDADKIFTKKKSGLFSAANMASAPVAEERRNPWQRHNASRKND